MIEATYWWEEAMKFSEHAESIDRPDEREEFLELANICKDVAAQFNHRFPGG